MDEWMRLRAGYSPGGTPPPPAPNEQQPPGYQQTQYQPHQYQQTQYRPPYRPSPDDRASERAARLTLTCLAASVAVLVVGIVVFFTVRSLREGEGAGAPALKAPPATTPEDAARLVGGIGPPQGTDVSTYVTARQQALGSATGPHVAVVSLSDYYTEAKARALVGSNEVVALLACAPGGQPAVVTGSLSDWANDQTAGAKADRDEIQKLIPTVDDPSFKNFYKSELDRLNTLISSIKPSGAVVFGVVVKGDATGLQALQQKDGVRLVDVGGADPDPSANYRGLRPEETTKANDPNTRPS